MTATVNRFASLVGLFLSEGNFPFEFDSVGCLDCALAVPAGAVPPLKSLAALVRQFVFAFAAADACVLRDEGRGALADHIEGWVSDCVVA